MSQFYKKTEVPSVGGVKSAAPSGPTRSREAHMEADSYRGGFAGAITDLLGVVNKGLNVAKAISEDDRNRMKKKFSMRADADIADYASYGRNYISKKAADEGRDIEDYNEEELNGMLGELKNSYVESKGLRDKEYFELLDSKLNDKGILLSSKQNSINTEMRKKRGMDALHVSAANNFKAMDAETYIGWLNDTMEQSVGPDAEIESTQEVVKASLMTPLMTAAMETKNPELLKKLQSKEMKEFFNVPDYDNVINGVKQQVQSSINKTKNVNFNKVEEQGYMLADNGFFKTEKDVDNFMDSQEFLEGYEPSSKDMFKLKKSLKKSVETEINYQEFEAATKSGDFTFSDRKGYSKEEKDALGNKYFKVETGISDTSPQGITDAINSGIVNDALKQYARSGVPFPSDIKAWANTPATGGVKGLKQKYLAFSQLNAMTQDTQNSISSVFNKKSHGAMMFAGQLIGKLEDGVIDEKEFQDSYITYTNDLQKNTDSYGVYTSPTAALYNKEETVQNWSNEFSKDAPWTWDDNASPAYIRRQVIGNFNIMVDAGLEPEAAMEKAEEMFEASHMRFENPDGSEGVMPSEFKNVLPESLAEVAANLPQLQPMKQMDELFGSEFMFKRKISVRPAKNYEQTKQIEVYYDGKPIGNTFMNREQFDDNWNSLQTKEAKRIRKNYEKRLEQLANTKEELDPKYKYR